jgi:predicted lipid-binding transport protein (Tim44 family)
VLQLILLAIVAALALLQLYAVLGRRVGRQPEDRAVRAPDAAPLRRPGVPLTASDEPPEGLAAVRARDPGFDHQVFLSTARSAYRSIVTAYAAGDREVLKPLLTPDVLAAFEVGMAEREAAGRQEGVEVLNPPRSDVETAEVDGDRARIVVRFLGELTQTTRDSAEAEPHAFERRTAELWTFERDLSDREGAWRLAGVDAAEA